MTVEGKISFGAPVRVGVVEPQADVEYLTDTIGDGFVSAVKEPKAGIDPRSALADRLRFRLREAQELLAPERTPKAILRELYLLANPPLGS